MAWRGKFTPKNPEKYVGDSSKIVFRSRIELRYFQYFDTNPAILFWNSEETVVPYFDPVKGKMRRYFPDALIKIRDTSGNEKTLMIEFKHSSDLKEPVPGKKKSKRFLAECADWTTNQAKWTAARAWCAERGIQFQTMSEKELGKSY